MMIKGKISEDNDVMDTIKTKVVAQKKDKRTAMYLVVDHTVQLIQHSVTRDKTKN